MQRPDSQVTPCAPLMSVQSSPCPFDADDHRASVSERFEEEMGERTAAAAALQLSLGVDALPGAAAREAVRRKPQSQLACEQKRES